MNDLPRHTFNRNPVLGLRRDVLGLDFLVGGLTHLEVALQVDPELETSGVDRSRHLRVHDPSAGSHPLDVTGAKGALPASEILQINTFLLCIALLTFGGRQVRFFSNLVKEHSFQQIGHRLESSVRMVRKPGPVVGIAGKLVEHEERIQVPQFRASDGPTDPCTCNIVQL